MNVPVRRTKIVCTIGPASNAKEIVEKLINAGMNIARINFSHGTHKEHAKYIRTLRQVAKKTGKSIAIMQDLPGPKDRTGRVKKGGVLLKEGSTFTLTTRHILGDEKGVSIDWTDLPSKIQKGNLIYIDDGAIKLEAIDSDSTEIKCKVITGGKLSDNKGVNVPGVNISSSITEADLDHIDFGIKNYVDFVAVSFIRDASDILKVRRLLDEKSSSAMLIAKIERNEALQNLDDILKVADGAMVARGDLGIEIPIERVPIAQKKIIEKCNKLGKPVIVATQMLESMVESPRPTRAEVTDVANAIFDGADAIMLSEETAIGHYPVEAVEVMNRVAIETERSLPYEMLLINKGKDVKPETDDAISYAACSTAYQLKAVAIVAFTSSGSTARRVCRYRPSVPILAITSSTVTMRHLLLSWGVSSFKVPSASRLSDLFKQGREVAINSGVAKSGDLVVITGGVPVGVSGSTNLLKVEKI